MVKNYRSIPYKETRKKSLGKIGEGAIFDVQWRENSNIVRHAKFSVYFHSNSIYIKVRIQILPDGEAVLYEGKQIYKPD